MAIRLRSLETLMKELDLKKPAALALLSDSGVRVINGCYDQNRLEAAMSEPKWLRSRRNEWSLAHSSGLGAVKYLLDPLKVNIVQHECRGAQWLMLESSAHRRQFVKMYYTGKMTGISNPAATFQLRNFVREDAPAFFVLVSFDGPHMWAVSSAHLRNLWNRCGSAKSRQAMSEKNTGFSVPAGHEKHAFGCLSLTVHTEDRRFKVDDIKKLGLA